MYTGTCWLRSHGQSRPDSQQSQRRNAPKRKSQSNAQRASGFPDRETFLVRSGESSETSDMSCCYKQHRKLERRCDGRPSLAGRHAMGGSLIHQASLQLEMEPDTRGMTRMRLSFGGVAARSAPKFDLSIQVRVRVTRAGRVGRSPAVRQIPRGVRRAA
jgi:hypothetical protein